MSPIAPTQNHHQRPLALRCSFVTLTYLCLSLLCCLHAHQAAIFQAPEIFNDSKHLPGRPEPEEADDYDVLGRVVKLNTYTNPQDVKKIETKFSIYNQLSRTDDITFVVDGFEQGGRKYPLDMQKLQTSRFDPAKGTVVIIAGYLSDDHQREYWLEHMKDTWLLLADTNVILVSWAANNRYVYDRAVANTPFVARQISIFLHYLSQLVGCSLRDEQFLKRIHFVGHSLGAHIAGYVGKDLTGKLGRITGLDPAGPSFDKYSSNKRLHYTDASLVEAFHTNAGRMRYLNFIGTSILKGVGVITNTVPGASYIVNSIMSQYSGEGDTAWFGLEDQVGHVDYYVNDGRVQPGCQGLLHTCDHSRSYEVLQSFLNYESMIAKQKQLPDTPTNSSSATQLRALDRHQNRFMAFKSKEFADFNVGYNFRLKCPSLLAGSVAWAGDSCKADTFKNCSVPIDMLAKVDDLKRELSQEYGINFANGTKNSKYFFMTRHEEPYLGDHYLLKLRLAREPIWSDQCMFRAEIKTYSGAVTSIKINKKSDLVNKQSNAALKDFQGIAIPFIHPNGPVSHYDLNDIFLNLDKQQQSSGGNITSMNQLDQQLKFNIRMHVPKSIHLYMSNAEATGLRETFGRIFSWVRGECEFDIVSVEIEPITPNSHAFISFYEPKQLNPNELAIKAFPRAQLVQELERRYRENNATRVYRLVRNENLSLNATELLLA